VPVLIDLDSIVSERSFPNFDSPDNNPGSKMTSSVFVADRPDRDGPPTHRADVGIVSARRTVTRQPPPEALRNR
jgi:hypothetical protein